MVFLSGEKGGAVVRLRYPAGTFIVQALAVITVLLLCAPQVTDQGGGTDYPNTRTVTGRIVGSDLGAASNTEVRLVSRNFLPTDENSDSCCIIDCTDDNGVYSVNVPDTGTYNLQAVHLGKRLRAFVPAIRVADSLDTIQVAESVLSEPGAIEVTLPASFAGRTGYVALRGTTIGTAVDGTAAAVDLDSVPSGTVASLYFVDAADASFPVMLQDSVEAATGETVYVAPHLGKRHVEIVLNTTATGADVGENVGAFPLVLRLAQLGVPVAELSDNGADLAVTGKNFVPLPFEIESWDGDAAEAVIWVLVDTIYGNSDRQSLFLFWGGGSFQRPAPSGPVFDTANGCAAVWHLNNRCIDATVNERDGTSVGAVADTAGILGGAQRFYGGDYFLIDGLLGMPASVTLSAWGLLDKPDSDGGEIVSVGDVVLIRMDDSWGDGKGCQGSFFSEPNFDNDSLTHEYIASRKFLAGTGWHHFTYVVDGDALVHRLYIDGELSGEAVMSVPVLWEGVGSSTVIGRHGNEKKARNFTGAIDEVCVANVPRTAAWIKLCYMNQKTDSRLVAVKK
jgi:hypothetical protein